MRRVTALVLVLAFIGATGIAQAADTYTIDVAHSSIGFAVKHLGLSKVKGTFNDFSGTILVDSVDIAKSSVNVTIKAASINTDNETRDKHLRSADFFETDKYSDITFVSEKIEKTAAGYVAHGNFTMHGVTKKIALPFIVTGPIKGMAGEYRLAVEAETKLDRQEYGISFSKTLDTGGLVVGNEVAVDIAIEAVSK